MQLSDDAVGESAIGFETALAYAFRPALRRLAVLASLGAVLSGIGLAGFLAPATAGLPGGGLLPLVWLGLATAGATLLVGSLLAALFALVADATYVASNR